MSAFTTPGIRSSMPRSGISLSSAWQGYVGTGCSRGWACGGPAGPGGVRHCGVTRHVNGESNRRMYSHMPAHSTAPMNYCSHSAKNKLKSYSYDLKPMMFSLHHSRYSFQHARTRHQPVFGLAQACGDRVQPRMGMRWPSRPGRRQTRWSNTTCQW